MGPSGLHQGVQLGLGRGDGGAHLLGGGPADDLAVGHADVYKRQVRGPWRQCERPIFAKDGGHGMLFTDLEGRLRLPIHNPNTTGLERPLFLTVRERGDALERI